MKAKPPLVPGTLRPLFLRIARASVASCMAGYVAAHVAGAEEAQEEDAGAHAEAGTWLAAPDAASARDADPTFACGVGRRPPRLRSGAPPESRTRIGAFLAQAAHLEAASVVAFFKLLRELRALGAPAALRGGALDAMLDEIDHARDVAELARAFGGQVSAPEVGATGLRSAFELAFENVGEACVRETFGALQATHQAETAADPRVRHVMAKIAEDEARHAELAWQLQAWLEPQLSERELTQVQAERTRVLEALASELDVGLSREEHATLGFPMPDVAGGMLRSLSSALYA